MTKCTEDFDLVSVIVLTYNNYKYLPDTLLSIEGQEGCKKEVIICDDGSRDEVRSAIKEIVYKFNNSEIFTCRVNANRTNNGTVRNINSGLAVARGKYVKIIAADDVYPDNRVFIRQIKKMNETGKKVVISEYCNCDENLEPMEDLRTILSNSFLIKMPSYKYEEGERIIRRYNLFPIATQACLFHISFFSDGFFNEKYKLIEDIELSKRIRKNPNSYEVLYILSVCHRENVGVSSKNNIKKRKSHVSKDYLLDCRRAKLSDCREEKGFLEKISIRNDIKYIDYLLLKNAGTTSPYKTFTYTFALLMHYASSTLIRIRQSILYKKLRNKK